LFFELLISLAAPNDVIYQPYRTSGKEDIDTKNRKSSQNAVFHAD
jgi:hypothetical protein